MASELKVDTIKHTNNTSAITLDTSGNVTLSGSANNIGTISAGTFNGTIGSSATFPNKNFFIAAYVTFDGSSDTGSGASQTILDSLNVSSVTRSGTQTGIFVVNLSITMANNNYVIIGSADGNGSSGAITQYDSNAGAISTTSFGIRVRNAGQTAYKNAPYTTLIVIGDR